MVKYQKVIIIFDEISQSNKKIFKFSKKFPSKVFFINQN